MSYGRDRSKSIESWLKYHTKDVQRIEIAAGYSRFTSAEFEAVFKNHRDEILAFHGLNVNDLTKAILEKKAKEMISIG